MNFKYVIPAIQNSNCNICHWCYSCIWWVVFCVYQFHLLRSFTADIWKNIT